MIFEQVMERKYYTNGTCYVGMFWAQGPKSPFSILALNFVLVWYSNATFIQKHYRMGSPTWEVGHVALQTRLRIRRLPFCQVFTIHCLTLSKSLFFPKAFLKQLCCKQRIHNLTNLSNQGDVLRGYWVNSLNEKN